MTRLEDSIIRVTFTSHFSLKPLNVLNSDRKRAEEKYTKCNHQTEILMHLFLSNIHSFTTNVPSSKFYTLMCQE